MSGHPADFPRNPLGAREQNDLLPSGEEPANEPQHGGRDRVPAVLLPLERGRLERREVADPHAAAVAAARARLVSEAAHQRVAGLDDGGRRSVVGANAEAACIGSEVAVEVREELKAGAGEAVDRLPVVADAEEPRARVGLANRVGEVAEHAREVLELVDHHEPQAPQIAALAAALAHERRIPAPHPLDGAPHQSVEVLLALRFQPFEVASVGGRGGPQEQLLGEQDGTRSAIRRSRPSGVRFRLRQRPTKFAIAWLNESRPLPHARPKPLRRRLPGGLAEAPEVVDQPRGVRAPPTPARPRPCAPRSPRRRPAPRPGATRRPRRRRGSRRRRSRTARRARPAAVSAARPRPRGGGLPPPLPGEPSRLPLRGGGPLPPFRGGGPLPAP